MTIVHPLMRFSVLKNAQTSQFSWEPLTSPGSLYTMLPQGPDPLAGAQLPKNPSPLSTLRASSVSPSGLALSIPTFCSMAPPMSNALAITWRRFLRDWNFNVCHSFCRAFVGHFRSLVLHRSVYEHFSLSRLGPKPRLCRGNFDKF